jgi:hypothetical protein
LLFLEGRLLLSNLHVSNLGRGINNEGLSIFSNAHVYRSSVVTVYLCSLAGDYYVERQKDPRSEQDSKHGQLKGCQVAAFRVVLGRDLFPVLPQEAVVFSTYGGQLTMYVPGGCSEEQQQEAAAGFPNLPGLGRFRFARKRMPSSTTKAAARKAGSAVVEEAVDKAFRLLDARDPDEAKPYGDSPFAFEDDEMPPLESVLLEVIKAMSRVLTNVWTVSCSKDCAIDWQSALLMGSFGLDCAG